MNNRSLRFSRFGLAEDPTGFQVVMPEGFPMRLADVLRPVPCARPGGSVGMDLEVRSFSREHVCRVNAHAVKVIE